MHLEQRSQQEWPWSRQTHTLLKLLKMYTQGQGNQEIYDPQHG